MIVVCLCVVGALRFDLTSMINLDQGITRFFQLVVCLSFDELGCFALNVSSWLFVLLLYVFGKKAMLLCILNGLFL
jgi:hypothetical protein